MRPYPMLTALLFVGLLAGCASDRGTSCCPSGSPSLRIVNAFTGSVSVLIDGQVAIPALAAGAIDSASPPIGSHTLEVRPAGSGSSASRTIITTPALSTIAAVRAAGGGVATAVLDDTNSFVPPGATKVRVLHLAPTAGTLQVYRTQPDYAQPVAWQFPFTYQATFDALSAPFFQSTVGTWEVRIWQTPADASGWSGAPVRVVIPLASGEKRTIVILDQAGGGVRVEMF